MLKSNGVRLIIILILALIWISACTEESKKRSKTNSIAGPAAILFPMANTIADSDVITVRGTVSDPEGVKSVTCNGIEAYTTDGYESWWVSVPLSFGKNAISVAVTDNSGFQTAGAPSIDVEYHGPFVGRIKDFTLDKVSQKMYFLQDDSLKPLISFDLQSGNREYVRSFSASYAKFPKYSASRIQAGDGKKIFVDDGRQIVKFDLPAETFAPLTDFVDFNSNSNSDPGEGFRSVRSGFFDEANNAAYYTSDGIINRIDLTTMTTSSIVNTSKGGVACPAKATAFTVDTSKERMFFSADNNAIYQLSSSGSGCSLLSAASTDHPISKPVKMLVDNVTESLFVDAGSKIIRVSLRQADVGTRTTLRNSDGSAFLTFNTVLDLAIDHTANTHRLLVLRQGGIDAVTITSTGLPNTLSLTTPIADLSITNFSHMAFHDSSGLVFINAGSTVIAGDVRQPTGLLEELFTLDNSCVGYDFLSGSQGLYITQNIEPPRLLNFYDNSYYSRGLYQYNIDAIPDCKALWNVWIEKNELNTFSNFVYDSAANRLIIANTYAQIIGIDADSGERHAIVKPTFPAGDEFLRGIRSIALDDTNGKLYAVGSTGSGTIWEIDLRADFPRPLLLYGKTTSPPTLLYSPYGIAVQSGKLLVTEYNRIVQIASTGDMSILAGTGPEFYSDYAFKLVPASTDSFYALIPNYNIIFNIDQETGDHVFLDNLRANGGQPLLAGAQFSYHAPSSSLYVFDFKSSALYRADLAFKYELTEIKDTINKTEAMLLDKFDNLITAADGRSVYATINYGSTLVRVDTVTGERVILSGKDTRTTGVIGNGPEFYNISPIAELGEQIVGIFYSSGFFLLRINKDGGDRDTTPLSGLLYGDTIIDLIEADGKLYALGQQSVYLVENTGKLHSFAPFAVGDGAEIRDAKRISYDVERKSLLVLSSSSNPVVEIPIDNPQDRRILVKSHMLRAISTYDLALAVSHGDTVLLFSPQYVVQFDPQTGAEAWLYNSGNYYYR